MRLDAEQSVPGAQIIGVSEHVDYWDGLGWRDPFSSSVFTERQEAYRQALGEPASYTPQMVIDGRVALVGSFERDVRQAIARAVGSPKAAMTVNRIDAGRPDMLTIRVRIARLPALGNGASAELWVGVTETGLATNVLRGENARRRLRHTAVARRLERVDVLPARLATPYETDIEVPLDPSWSRDQLRVVGFIQETSSRAVLGGGPALAGALSPLGPPFQSGSSSWLRLLSR